MSCKELPTKEGAVVAWSYYYDGRNYRAATLTYDIGYEMDEDGVYVKIPDPEYPEGYEDGEPQEMIASVVYEGLMWQETGSQRSYTPEEFANRHRIDHAWWDKFHPGMIGPDENYSVNILREGFDPK